MWSNGEVVGEGEWLGGGGREGETLIPEAETLLIENWWKNSVPYDDLKVVVASLLENECFACKYENIKKFSIFQAQKSLECYFSSSLMLKCQRLLTF